MKYIIIFSIFLVNFDVFSAENKKIIPLNKDFVHAIGQIESNNNDFAIGDNGKALGRYQIWKVCYLDAKEFNKSIKFSYESLTNKANSLIVLESYLNRYGAKYIKNNDFESLARIWNGGPQGNKKQNTIKYWQKIKARLNMQNKG